MKFGYARAGTVKPNRDRQIEALKAYGVDEIYEEKIPGANRNRPQLDLVLRKLRPGDSLVVYELKGLGRNTRQLLALAEEFNQNRVEFVSLTESLDTRQLLVLAKLDRDIISENTKSGLASARSRGHIGGRQPIDEKKIDAALKMYHSGEFSIKEILAYANISKSCLYSYIKNKKLERRRKRNEK